MCGFGIKNGGVIEVNTEAISLELWACCTDAGVTTSTTGVERECFLHRGQNKRVVCYVSVSLVLLCIMNAPDILCLLNLNTN